MFWWVSILRLAYCLKEENLNFALTTAVVFCSTSGRGPQKTLNRVTTSEKSTPKGYHNGIQCGRRDLLPVACTTHVGGTTPTPGDIRVPFQQVNFLKFISDRSLVKDSPVNALTRKPTNYCD